MIQRGVDENGLPYIRTLTVDNQVYQLDSPARLAQLVRHGTCPGVHYHYIHSEWYPPRVVSIVMTSRHRPEATMCTLRSLARQSTRDLMAVVLVEEIDDQDFLSCRLDDLSKWSTEAMIPMVYVTVLRTQKTWMNPCVNYNIGFQVVFDHLRTPYSIIQNAEVCHIGEVVDYGLRHMMESYYLVYDVVSSPGKLNNRVIEKSVSASSWDKIYTLMKQHSAGWTWYQNSLDPACCGDYHFLTMISTTQLATLGGFDYRMAYGSCFDDNVLVHQIKSRLGLQVIRVPHKTQEVMGVHQWHPQMTAHSPEMYEYNEHMFRSIQTEIC
jgi:hypothetical protein